MILAALVLLALSGSGTIERGDSLQKALAFVPPEAKAIGVIPSLSTANQDLGELIDAMNRPATVLAGRPIEMVKAQFGIGAELDESGSVIGWLELPPGDSNEPIPVLLLPTQDSDAFLVGNFSRDEAAGSNAWRTAEGELLFSRGMKNHVMLSPEANTLKNYDAKGGAAELFRARLGAQAVAHASRGDVILWIDGGRFAC